MTRAAWSALVLAVLVGQASAGPAAPAGWTRDEATSERASAATEATYRADARRARVEVDSYRAPAGPATYFVTRVAEDLAAELPTGAEGAALIERCSAIASETLAQIVATPAREQGRVEQSTQRWVPDRKVLEGAIRWTAKDGTLRVAARTVVAATGARVTAITGECFLGADAPAALEQACTAALDRLDVDLAMEQRIPLALQAGGPTDTPSGAPSDLEILPDSAPAPGTATETTGSRLTAGPGGVLMTMAPAPRPVDRRPVYFGLGVVVLAGVFWWNRQRRDRFEADGPAGGEPGTGPRVRTAPRPGRPARDDDADDLAAAARGPAPPDPEDPA